MDKVVGLLGIFDQNVVKKTYREANFEVDKLENITTWVMFLRNTLTPPPILFNGHRVWILVENP